MEHNGHERGRSVPSERLEPFTFQSTGRTVCVRKVSSLIRDEVRRQVRRDPAFAEPQPPLFEVDYGNGKQLIPNKSHETYLQLMTDWQTRVASEVGERLKALVIRRGVVCEVDREATAQVRAELAAIDVDTADQDDHYVYIAYVCIGAHEDWLDLLRAVFERSAPAEAAIQAHIDTFRPDLRGEGSVASEPGPAAGEAEVDGGSVRVT